MAALRFLLMAWAAAICAVFVPAGAAWGHDDAISAGARCSGASAADMSVEAAVTNPSFWRCDDNDWQASEPVAWLRFERSDWNASQLPSSFFTRISQFAAITVATLDEDGTLRQRTYDRDFATPRPAGPVFSVPLPPVTDATDYVVVRIAEPHSIPMLTEARLASSVDAIAWSYGQFVLMALLLGMLITPLVFDISFYAVLREPFVLLHALMVTCMIGYLLLAGGLITALVTLPVAFIAVGAPAIWAVGIGISAFFMLTFIERDVLPPMLARAIRLSGWWAILVPGFFSLQFSWTQAFDDTAYFLSFLPVIAIYIGALIYGLWQRSRSAQFIAAAWIPLLCASLERLMRGLGIYAGPATLDMLLFVGLALEVVIISLGVGYRFVAVRKERDQAVDDASMMEELSERDPLTGLLNRRVIDDRFDDLRRGGYETFALIDLDKFKTVNDTVGHSIGDDVLRCVADVLRQAPDTIAVRMGGEEFLLLMRGEDSAQRAEALRQSIPVRIAREVVGLDHVVTASMGLVIAPRRAMPNAEFIDLYTHADRLLYEAKEHGRNRGVTESMRAFRKRAPDRRRAAA